MVRREQLTNIIFTFAIFSWQKLKVITKKKQESNIRICVLPRNLSHNAILPPLTDILDLRSNGDNHRAVPTSILVPVLLLIPVSEGYIYPSSKQTVKVYITFTVPTIKRELTNHFDICYFCIAKFGGNYKKRTDQDRMFEFSFCLKICFIQRKTITTNSDFRFVSL